MRPPNQLPASPLWRGYYAGKPWSRAYLSACDLLLKTLKPEREKSSPISISNARKILVLNGAHLGDVLYSTTVLRALKENFPWVRLGFLCGSWSLALLRHHPLVDYVHVLDHWILNRARLSTISKLKTYFSTRYSAIREIKQIAYDVAIDLYPFYPNSADVIWASGVPIRIGFRSCGFSALLTHPFAWDYVVGDHILDTWRKLLCAIGLKAETLQGMSPSLPRLPEQEKVSFWKEINRLGLSARNYVVIHPGVGLKAKEWSLENWRAVVEKLAAWVPVVFTGAGIADERKARFLVPAHGKYVNLVNRLEIREFIELVAGARLLIGHDSFAVHVAGALGVPTLAIFSGTNPNLFRPLGRNAKILYNRVPCSPCFIGCKGMECIRELDPSDVIRAAESVLFN